jgi:hypothetical protein
VESTDPFVISASVVKASAGAYGESDFLPLFYKPLSGYWALMEQQSAGVWNSAGEYYEGAWQSFRVGDEVVIQYDYSAEDYVPQRVIGFFSGAPRLGENVFKVQSTPVYDNDCPGLDPQWMYFLAYLTKIWNGEPDWEEYFQPADFGLNYFEDCYGANMEPEAPGDVALSSICNDDGSNFKMVSAADVLSGYATQWFGMYDGGYIASQISAGAPLVCGTYEGTVVDTKAIYRRVRTWWSYDAYYHFWAVGPVMFCWPVYLAKWSRTPTVDVTWWLASFYRNWTTTYIDDDWPESVPCVAGGCNSRMHSQNWYDVSWPDPPYNMSSHPLYPYPETEPVWDGIEEFEMAESGTYISDACPSGTYGWSDTGNYYPYAGTSGTDVYNYHRSWDAEWFGLENSAYAYSGDIFACLYTPARWASACEETIDDMYLQSDLDSTWWWYVNEPIGGGWSFVPAKHQSPTSLEE